MWSILLTVVLAAPPEVTARTLDGKSVEGALVEVQADRFVLQSAAGAASLEFKNLLRVTPKVAPVAPAVSPKAWLQLVDGSQLVGLGFRSVKGQAEFTTLDGQSLKLSTKAIDWVRFKEQSEAIAAQWNQIVDSKRSSDLIVIRQAETVDFLEGVLGDATADAVQFTLDGDLSNVKLAKIEGLLYFHPAGKTLAAPLCQMTDAAGSVLQVAKLAAADDKLKITTVAGAELLTPLTAVADLDFSLGKLQYLGDLKPESMQRTSYFGSPRGLDSDLYYDPKVDRSFDGGPLKLGNQSYSKGLAIKSRTRLVYRLPGKFSRFEAIAGIDAGVAPLGSVKLLIYGDDSAKPLFEGLVRGKDAPQNISLDLAGAKRLVIEVDFGEGGDIGDHLDLCEARVIQ